MCGFFFFLLYIFYFVSILFLDLVLVCHRHGHIIQSTFADRAFWICVRVAVANLRHFYRHVYISSMVVARFLMKFIFLIDIRDIYACKVHRNTNNMLLLYALQSVSCLVSAEHSIFKPYTALIHAAYIRFGWVWSVSFLWAFVCVCVCCCWVLHLFFYSFDSFNCNLLNIRGQNRNMRVCAPNRKEEKKHNHIDDGYSLRSLDKN